MAPPSSRLRQQIPNGPLLPSALGGNHGNRLSSQPAIDITSMPDACNRHHLLDVIHVIDHPIRADSLAA